MKIFFKSIISLILVTAFSATANAAVLEWGKLRPLLTSQPGIEGQPSPVIPDDGPVVVTFWASWCPPCTNEFKELNEIKSKINAMGAKIVGVNLYEDFGGRLSPVRMQRFLTKTEPQFPLVQGNEEIGTAFGNVTRIPTVVVFGKSGKEVWRFIHVKDAKKTHATMEDVLAALELAQDN